MGIVFAKGKYGAAEQLFLFVVRRELGIIWFIQAIRLIWLSHQLLKRGKNALWTKLGRNDVI